MPIETKDVGTTATRVLVTGFGPFPGAPENPTLGMLRDLEAEGVPGALIVTARLPVTFGGVAAALREAAARARPDAVLMLGLAVGRDVLHVERIARNEAGGRAGTDGVAPETTHLVAEAPATLAATWPATDVLAALRAAGQPATLSEDAGGYVCNAALYHALHEGLAGSIGFLHVPAIGTGGTTPNSLAAAARVVIGALIGRASLPDVGAIEA